MRFLLDVHINASLARLLRSHGHEVVQAAIEYGRWSDERLLDLAVREDRILVSQDSDFSDLIYAELKPSPLAVVYIRCEPDEQIEMNGRVLGILETAQFRGHMVVIEPTKIRYRPLPESEQYG